ncbi:hypothetical protein B0H14DRAFT_2559337 [Mycena olivaceomarginata]|nr:hypothetical protein B0H14DRAFT_2559337 [Mycena olivaceomarginata]
MAPVSQIYELYIITAVDRCGSFLDWRLAAAGGAPYLPEPGGFRGAASSHPVLELEHDCEHHFRAPSARALSGTQPSRQADKHRTLREAGGAFRRRWMTTATSGGEFNRTATALYGLVRVFAYIIFGPNVTVLHKSTCPLGAERIVSMEEFNRVCDGSSFAISQPTPRSELGPFSALQIRLYSVMAVANAERNPTCSNDSITTRLCHSFSVVRPARQAHCISFRRITAETPPQYPYFLYTPAADVQACF